MLAWCSIWVMTISSPADRWASAQEQATRLIASVTFLVKTMFSGAGAFSSPATFSRTPS